MPAVEVRGVKQLLSKHVFPVLHPPLRTFASPKYECPLLTLAQIHDELFRLPMVVHI